MVRVLFVSFVPLAVLVLAWALCLLLHVCSASTTCVPRPFQSLPNPKPQQQQQQQPSTTTTPNRFDEYHPITFTLDSAFGTSTPSLDALEAFAPKVALLARRELMGPGAATLLGLHELIAYGLRGAAAYAHHAEMLGQVDPALDDFCEVRDGWRRGEGLFLFVYVVFVCVG